MFLPRGLNHVRIGPHYYLVWIESSLKHIVLLRLKKRSQADAEEEGTCILSEDRKFSLKVIKIALSPNFCVEIEENIRHYTKLANSALVNEGIRRLPSNADLISSLLMKTEIHFSYLTRCECLIMRLGVRIYAIRVKINEN